MFTRDRLSAYILRLKEVGRAFRPRRRVPIQRSRPRLACELLESRLAPAQGNLLFSLTEPVGAAGNNFGNVVAVSNQYILVGTPGANGTEGAAYLYTKAGALVQQFTEPVPASGDAFGSSVAISGSTVVIGAPGFNSRAGAAYIFSLFGSAPVQLVSPTPAAGDDLGVAVATDGANVLVGADGANLGLGAAALFSTTGAFENYYPNPGVLPQFGHAVAISGNELAIGAPQFKAGGAGTAYLLNQAGTIQLTYTDPNGVLGDDFGGSLAIDGNNVLIGAANVNNGEGAAYLYTNTSTTVQVAYSDPSGDPVADFGSAVAISGTNVLVGAQRVTAGAGAAYLYSTGGPTLLQPFTDLTGAVGDGFGAAVGVASNQVVVGAPRVANGSGAVYVYTTANSMSAFAGNGESTTVGTPFPTSLEAQVTDAAGNPVSGASVTFTVVNAASGATGTFATSATVVTNSQGIAIAPALTADDTAGAFSVVASLGAMSTTFQLSNTSAAAATITALAGSLQSTAVGTSFGTALQALVTDAFGNVVPGVPVTFAVTPAAASGTFAGSSIVLTNAQGVATAPALTANTTTGTFTVTATAGNIPTASFTLTNTVGAPEAIAVLAGNNQATLVGTPFPTALAIIVVDAFDDAVPNTPVTFTVMGGSSAGAAFAAGSQITVVTNAQGIATAPTLTANGTIGTFAVNATVGDLTTSFTLTNTDAPASILQLSGTPQSAVVGTVFGTRLEADVLDSAGNPLANVPVTFSVPTNGATGTFLSAVTSPTVLTNAQGIATAPAILANTTIGTFTVTATVAGLPGVGYTLTNTVGAPASISVQAGNLQNATVGNPFGAALSVLVSDAAGNPLPSIPVSFTEADGAAGAGATFTVANGPVQSSSTTDINGIASTTTPLIANDFAGTFTVVARVGNLFATFVLTNNAGAVALLTAVAGGNQSATVGTAFASRMEVLATDAFGNVVPGMAVMFTAPNAAGSAGGAFTGGTTVTTNVRGLAFAPVLTANATAGSFNVTAAAGGLSAGFALTNSSGAPTNVLALSGTPQLTPVSSAFGSALTAEVTDANGNPVANVPVTFSVPAAGASATFLSAAGTPTVLTNSQGVATAPTLVANGQLGLFTATATVGALPAATYSLKNVVGAPASITIQAGNNQDAAVSGLFGIPLAVVVKDAFGNPVSGMPVTFTEVDGTTGAGATFGNGTNQFIANTLADGSAATTTTLTAKQFAGTFTVIASAGTLATTFLLASTPGAVALLTPIAGNNQSATVNTAFGSPLEVLATDSFGNPVPGAIITFTAPSAAGTASIAAMGGTVTATTNAHGLATAPVLTATTTAGSFTVTATSNGVSAAFALTNLAGAPTSIVPVGTAAQSTIIGTAFGSRLQALVTDAFGNPVPTAPVTFAVPYLSEPITAASTAQNGALFVATFTTQYVTGLRLGDPVMITGMVPAAYNGAYNVSSVIDGNDFTVNLRTNANPGQATGVGAVQVPDALAYAGGSSESFGALPTVLTNAQGIATAPTLTANQVINPPDVSYTATATVVGTGLPPALFSLTNTSTPYSITVDPASVQSAEGGFAFSLVADVTDFYDRPLPGATVTFVVIQPYLAQYIPGSAPPTVTPFARSTSASGFFANSFGAAVTSMTATTLLNGATPVMTLQRNANPGTFHVDAYVNGDPVPAVFTLTNVRSGQLSVSPAATAQPSASTTATVTGAFTGQFSAIVTNTLGKRVAGQAVTFAVPNRAGVASGTFAGLAPTPGRNNTTIYTVITDASGRATAGTFTANQVAGSYSMIVSWNGQSQAIPMLNLAGAPFSAVTVGTTTPAATANNFFASPLQVQVKDQFGNPVAPGQSVTFTVNSVPNGPSPLFFGALAPGNTVTVATGRNGIATTPLLRAGSTKGTVTVTVTIGGITLVNAFQLTIN